MFRPTRAVGYVNVGCARVRGNVVVVRSADDEGITCYGHGGPKAIVLVGVGGGELNLFVPNGSGANKNVSCTDLLGSALVFVVRRHNGNIAGNVDLIAKISVGFRIARG